LLVKAKEYSEDLKKHFQKTSKTKAIGTKKDRLEKYDENAYNKKGNSYGKPGTTGIHKKSGVGKPDRDVFSKKNQLAKQKPLVF